ncbi:flagellar basal-body rod protein FlgF [Buchnera aphidicola]|uniref:Flagellar basal-body rod protein FlgF n=1 Tax=Buchnera aphidicola str. USDA (Myzus persicae) TaxID=1009856 RepID=W0NZV4_BUCMP|nr:flagellar basal-body rod protein FlgF [Buchnera aphidicola]AHG60046.1 Flgf [Buchnera aphidicola str. USDA (Myzus persicae)]AHG60626.1 Flgf [Buchnera aphidicola str. W106 (Myzus persicae)]AHG61198.1 Flgf [Buchnera aphidicola str. G002 (Myzus persicae)]AHG61771.1 Flgf [Buchnera aphidicola str. F009 (Myzus persicae)]WAI03269.1 MAG: flagellar basal-body rod protein FlgF [Buchnera aphidicola (Myzus persicae)]
MENAIYHSMMSAKQLLEKQTIISNNLANISTNGFKEKFNYILQDENTNNLFNNHHPIIKEYYNLSPGILHHTQRNLDLFIKDDGWLTVKDINGEEAYTKNGHLKINAARKLTIQDNEVVGHNSNIEIPDNVNLKILSNGIITVIEKKNKKIFTNQIGALKLVSLPWQNLIQKENGLFYLKKDFKSNKYSHIINHNNNIRVQAGFLESSNVNTSKNMIEMISNARQFEMQMKMISTCDQNFEYANQLININN